MSKISNTEEFIYKSNVIYNFIYDYSLVEYVNAHKKVKILCHEHGYFEITPNKHLSRKSGCPKCGIKQRNNSIKYTTEKFIEKANKVHSNKYNYNEVDYKSSEIKIKILCNLHGIFEQFPKKHLYGDGCPLCGNITISKKASENPTGWANSNWIESSKKSKYFDSFKVYIIKCFNDEEEFYKIGKTFQLIKRRFHAKKEMPYNYEVIKLIIGEAIEITDLEAQLKRVNKKHSYLPKIKFHGMYECFSSIEEQMVREIILL